MALLSLTSPPREADPVPHQLQREESGAHQQARAENAMFRYKRVLGDRLRARMFDAQEREAMIGMLVINRMTELRMPESTAVVN